MGVTARVTVDEGLVWAHVPDAVSAPTVEIRVGTAVLRARPAEMGLEVAPSGDAVIEVVEGTVALLPAGEESVQLGANQALHLSAQGTVVEMAPVSAEELEADTWVTDNRALDERRPRQGRRTARLALLAAAVLVVAAAVVVAVRAVGDDETVRSRREPTTTTSPEGTTGETTEGDAEGDGGSRRTTTEGESEGEDERERDDERTTTTERRSTTEGAADTVPDGSGASQTTVEQRGVVGTVPLTTFGTPPMEGASEQ